MLKLSLLSAVVFSSLLMSAPAMAADENVDIVPRDKEKTVKSEGQVSSRGIRSRDHRAGKTVELNLMPIGFSSYSINQAGVNVGFFISGQSQILLSVAGGNSDPCLADSFSTCKAEDRSFGVAYKQFFGNSFYMQAGVSQHATKYSKDYDDGLSPYEIGFEEDVTAADILIGNQWSWSSFTLGVDWFGVSAPINYKIKNGYYTGAGGSDEYDEKVKDYEGRTNAYLTRLYVGFSF